MSFTTALAKTTLDIAGDAATTPVAADAVPCAREPAACTEYAGSRAKPQDRWSQPRAAPPAGYDVALAAASTASSPSSSSGPAVNSEAWSRIEGISADSAGCSESLLMLEWRRGLMVVQFFTRLPCPTWVDHDPRHLFPGMVYLPAIGCVVGVWVWLWMDALAAVFPRVLASTGAVMMGTWLTGFLHESAHADIVDVYRGDSGKKEILRIMKDLRVGIYVVIAISLFIFAKLHTLSLIPEVSIGPTILVGHVLARWTVLPICYMLPYIAASDEENDQAAYNPFVTSLSNGSLSMSRVVVASVCAVAIAISGLGWAKAFTVITGQIVLCIGSARYARGVWDGGVIGDYLEVTIMVSELLTYLLLAADWQKFMAGGWWRVLRLLVVLYPLSHSMVGAWALPKDRAAKDTQHS